MLKSLQSAVPILLRHLDGYIELAEQDWAAAKISLRERLQLTAVAMVGAVFSLLAICLFVVAATWDTDYRLLAIGLMTCLFIATTVSAIVKLGKKKEAAFDRLRREWEQDRDVVQRLLSESYADHAPDKHAR